MRNCQANVKYADAKIIASRVIANEVSTDTNCKLKSPAQNL